MRDEDQPEESLQDVLTEFMNREAVGHERLRTIIKHKSLFHISASTIRRWKEGTSKQARDWRGLISVAIALNLTELEVNRLLKSAGKPTLLELQAQATTDEDKKLLEPWLEEAPLREINENLKKIHHILEEQSEYNISRDTQNGFKDTVKAVTTNSIPSHSRMLLHPNPVFSGRQTELQKLIKLFLKNRRVAIVGLGGIGKTQLAVEFAHRSGGVFSGGVFYLSCADPSQIDDEIAACGGAGALGIDNFESWPLVEKVALVKKAWREPVSRLLIFDNLEEPNILNDLMPTTGGAKILITSQRSQWPISFGVEQLELRSFLRDDSLDLLHKLSPSLNHEIACELAIELGDLPLALHLAGSYLERYQRAIQPEAYLAALRDDNLLAHISLQGKRSGISPTDHEMHVGRTFELSFKRLDQQNETGVAALTVLAHIAYCAPGEPLPNDLLLVTLPDGIRKDPFLYEDALSRLSELGILRNERGFVQMHRLVNVFIRNKQEPVQNIEKTVLKEIERRDPEFWGKPVVHLWMPHLIYLTQQAKARNDVDATTWCHSYGEFLYWHGRMKEALDPLQWALEFNERVLGETHADTGSVLHTLGMVYGALGKLELSRTCDVRALQIRQNAPNVDYVELGKTLNNLGFMLIKMGRLNEGQAFLDQSLKAKRESSTTEDSSYFVTFTNLGLAAHIRGDFEQAQEHYAQSSVLREKFVDAKSPTLARFIFRRGLLFYRMGEKKKGHEEINHALSIFQEIWGQNNPEIPIEAKTMGMLFLTNKDQVCARICFEYALQLFTDILGEDHEETKETKQLLKQVA